MKECKPCPFEKTPNFEHKLAIYRENIVGALPRVGCTCGARGPVAELDDQSAIDAWNMWQAEDNKMLKNVLKFYADSETYKETSRMEMCHGEPHFYETSKIGKDRGEKAKRAMKESKQ